MEQRQLGRQPPNQTPGVQNPSWRPMAEPQPEPTPSRSDRHDPTMVFDPRIAFDSRSPYIHSVRTIGPIVEVDATTRARDSGFIACQVNITTAKQAAEALRPLAGNGAYLLFTLGLIGTGMLGVPVLVGSCAYAVAEGAAWRGSMNDKPKRFRKFYAVMGMAMVLGLLLNYLGFNPVKMLFWSAVINGLLAPPLILLVVLLTSSRKVMGKYVNPAVLKYLGWITFVVMTAAAVGMICTS